MLSFIDSFVRQRNFSHVLEAGGIDRPLLERSKEIRYDGLDIEHKERCEHIYDNFIVQSIEESFKYKYDLIISKALLEHVQDNDASVTQMYEASRTGGYVIHYLPYSIIHIRLS